MRRLIALFAGMVMLATAFVLAPPRVTVPTAEAAPVAYVYNSKQGNSTFQVFQKADGKGTFDRVQRGKKSKIWRVGTPDSFYVARGCHLNLSTTITRRLYESNYYVSRGRAGDPGKVWNFPKWMVGQRVVAVYRC